MDAEEQLTLIEGMNTVCSILDSMKTGLEERGWQPTLAAQAAIQIGGPMILNATGVLPGPPPTERRAP